MFKMFQKKKKSGDLLKDGLALCKQVGPEMWNDFVTHVIGDQRGMVFLTQKILIVLTVIAHHMRYESRFTRQNPVYFSDISTNYKHLIAFLIL